MKMRKIIWMCLLALVTVLGCCIMTPSSEPVEDVQEKTEQGTTQNTQEKTEQEVTQKDTQEKTDAETTQKESQAENEASEPDVTLLEAAMHSYQEILQAAPAIEGEHEELNDASFGYEQNLEKFGNHYDMFAVIDINQDEIPELIALSKVNFRWMPVSVYTYADGKAVLLKDPKDMLAHGTFEQNSAANGAYSTYICEENHIHSAWRGTNPFGEIVVENSAYAIEGTNLIAVDCTFLETETNIYFPSIAKPNTEEYVKKMIP